MVGKKVRKVVVSGCVGTDTTRKHAETLCGVSNISSLASSLHRCTHVGKLVEGTLKMYTFHCM